MNICISHFRTINDPEQWEIFNHMCCLKKLILNLEILYTYGKALRSRNININCSITVITVALIAIYGKAIYTEKILKVPYN